MKSENKNKPLMLFWGPYLMVLLPPNYFPNASSPNTLTFEFVDEVSNIEFWEVHVQTTAKPHLSIPSPLSSWSHSFESVPVFPHWRGLRLMWLLVLGPVVLGSEDDSP